jgi:hypothetical protein
MSPVGFEPTIPASERPQTHALDRAANGIGFSYKYLAITELSVEKIHHFTINDLQPPLDHVFI